MFGGGVFLHLLSSSCLIVMALYRLTLKKNEQPKQKEKYKVRGSTVCLSIFLLTMEKDKNLILTFKVNMDEEVGVQI